MRDTAPEAAAPAGAGRLRSGRICLALPLTERSGSDPPAHSTQQPGLAFSGGRSGPCAKAQRAAPGQGREGATWRTAESAKKAAGTSDGDGMTPEAGHPRPPTD
jgi:hypothetical protein